MVVGNRVMKLTRRDAFGFATDHRSTAEMTSRGRSQRKPARRPRKTLDIIASGSSAHSIAPRSWTRYKRLSTHWDVHSKLRYKLLVLGHDVLPLALYKEIAHISECTQFHLLLRITRLCAQMRKQCRIRELQKPRVYRRLVWEHVQTDGSELCSRVRVVKRLTPNENART